MKSALAAILFAAVVAAQGDPRPECTDERCRKAQAFLTAHYCGEMPFGNGPDEGCLIRRPEHPAADVVESARFEMPKEADGSEPRQMGQVPPDVRAVLLRELRQLGLPAGDDKHVYYTLWRSKSGGWSVAEAYYFRMLGDELALCQVIAISNHSSRWTALRKTPYIKADVDLLRTVTWSLIDAADVDGDGKPELLLQGDAYEDHWLEAVSLGHDSAITIFSGLGYWL